MKNTNKTTASAILAGSMVFAGAANAATVFTEDFESGTAKWATSWGTYGTATNFSGSDHTTAVAGGGGATYANLIGGQGATTDEADVVSNAVAISAGDLASVDAGTATWTSSMWAASYTSGVTERVQISLEFFSDAAGTVSLGAATAIMTDSGSTVADADWTQFNNNGTVAALARSFKVTYGSTNGNDAYLDDLNFTITPASAPIPEPSSTALLGLGGLALILRRRK